MLDEYEYNEEENAVISAEELEKRTKDRMDALGNSDNQIAIAKYEEEQEKKAIISYDELIQKNYPGAISYSDTSSDDDILVKKVDLEDTQRINIEKIKEEKEKVENLLNYYYL